MCIYFIFSYFCLDNKPTILNYKLLTSLLFIIVSASCSIEENDTELSDQIEINLSLESQYLATQTILLDVPYGTHEQQVFDIYLPEGRTTQETKVILMIHGGGWVNGDKNSFTDFVLELKENNPNHAIVNINYVLGTEDHYAFPNQFFDIQNVINYIKSKQNKFRIKPEFGLIGSSAGAHLALQYTYKYDFNNDVKFVASLGGPTDFLDPFYESSSVLLTDFLVDKSYYQNTITESSITDTTDFLKILSPTYQITEESSPTLLIYGKEDMTVPLSNAIVVDKYLELNNVESSFNLYNGGHGGWNTESQIEITHGIIKKFIESHLYVSE